MAPPPQEGKSREREEGGWKDFWRPSEGPKSEAEAGDAAAACASATKRGARVPGPAELSRDISVSPSLSLSLARIHSLLWPLGLAITCQKLAGSDNDGHGDWLQRRGPRASAAVQSDVPQLPSLPRCYIPTYLPTHIHTHTHTHTHTLDGTGSR
ncbi:hypothetical protein CDD83_4554 [Cordyceps sp. RAO-2017]|nr:hypothetical protein CDD83_4554 [Cordyceps sp. RAO-2017]